MGGGGGEGVQSRQESGPIAKQTNKEEDKKSKRT